MLYNYRNLIKAIGILLFWSFTNLLADEPFIRWHYPFNTWFSSSNDSSKVKSKQEIGSIDPNEEARDEEPYVQWRSPLDDIFDPNYSEMEGLEVDPFPLPVDDRIAIDEDRNHSLRLLSESSNDHFKSRYIRPSHLFFTRESVNKVEVPEVQPITLEQAIRYTLETNLNIQIRDIQTDIEDDRIEFEKGAFDPTLEVSTSFSKNRVPQNTQEFVSSGGVGSFGFLSGEPNVFSEENENYSTALKGKFQTGLGYELSYNLSTLNNSVNRNSIHSLFSPEYSSGLSLQITQPLLREAGRAVNLAPIRIARRNREIAFYELQAVLQQTLAEMIHTYFDFVFAKEELYIRSAEVEVFSLLVDEWETRVEKGLASGRQLISVKSRHNESVDRQYIAKQNLVDSRSRLLEFFNWKNNDLFVDPLFPVGQFSQEIPSLNQEDLIRSTLANSPELMRFQQELERDKLELKVALDGVDPQFDLVASIGNVGLDSNLYSSIHSGFEKSTYTMEIGIVYSRPWDNSGAKAKVREMKQKKRQTELEISKVKHHAVSKILRYYSALLTQKDRYRNAVALRGLMEAEINEEEILIEKGEKSIYETLDFYKSLYDARIRELSVLRDLNQSKTNLWLANGSLLDRLGVIYKD